MLCLNLTSCKNDEEIDSDTQLPLIGKWEMTKMIAVSNDYDVKTFNFAKNKINYYFRSDGKLLVTGNDGDLSSGEHLYKYKIPLGCSFENFGVNLFIDVSQPILGNEKSVSCGIKNSEKTIEMCLINIEENPNIPVKNLYVEGFEITHLKWIKYFTKIK